MNSVFSVQQQTFIYALWPDLIHIRNVQRVLKLPHAHAGTKKTIIKKNLRKMETDLYCCAKFS